jgi:Thermophilic metalloprotease (M29)
MMQFNQIKPSQLTHEQIKQGFELILLRSLSVKPNQDLVLVIFDETFRPYVQGFAEVISEHDINADLKFLPLQYQLHLVEKIKDGGIPESLKYSFDRPNAAMCLLSGWNEGQSLRGEIVRNLQRNKNCRLAHVPGLSDDVLEVVARTDFDSVVSDCELMAWVLGNGDQANIYTTDSLGQKYELTMDLGGWNNEPLMSPGIIEQGSWGNFPPAETFCCPRRDHVNGEICINGSIPGIVLNQGEEIVLKFIDGKMIGWTTPVTNSDIRITEFFNQQKSKAETSGDINWNSFCEFGIGLNRAINNLTGSCLFDEKIAETIHIAIGGNTIFGHSIKSHVHFDLIIKEATVLINGEIVIKNGQIQKEELKQYRQNWRPGATDITEDKMIRINSSEISYIDNQLVRRLQSGGRGGNVAMADREVATQLALLATQIGDEPIRFGELLNKTERLGQLSIEELISYLWHYRTLLIS